MNSAAGLVAEIDAEIADRAFHRKTVDDIGCRTGLELCRNQCIRLQEPAAGRLALSGNGVIDDVLLAVAFALINRIEKADADLQPG